MSKGVHIVKMNETLSHIAKEHYGNVDYWKGLLYANKDSIKKYEFVTGFVLINPGQEINLPDDASVKSYTDNINHQINTHGAEKVSLDSEVSEDVHIVKMNETLSHIAKEHYGNVDYWKGLLYVNKDTIKKFDFVKGFVLINPGQVINLPDDASVKSYTDKINEKIKTHGAENVTLDF